MHDAVRTFNQLVAAAGKDAATLAGASLYPLSCFDLGGATLGLAQTNQGKRLVCWSAGSAAPCPELQGEVISAGTMRLKVAALTHANAVALRRLLPWTAPVSLRNRRTTIGCGDRLGRATPGHIRAIRNYDAYPVLAQQSIRELNLTGRTYEQVVDDVSFLVLQEGFTKGFGADGDHLKTLKDIDVAVDAGMAMITLDLSEVMNAAAEHWGAAEIEAGFQAIPENQRQRILASYADKSFTLQGTVVAIPVLECKRCAVMYHQAMDFAAEVNALLRQRRGDAYDLEISIDETKAPTLPAHHLYIIKELLHRNVTVSSLAPRFIGEFQKAVDYIGDLGEFEKQFALHCAIAAAHGGYKVSIHSGSDKFSAYPVIGRYTALRVHVKTAGTSWLEAVRTIAQVDATLYADLHAKALAFYPEALKYYHVTPDMTVVPTTAALASLKAADLMDQDATRQVLHVTYGGILHDAALAKRFFQCLDQHEEAYYANLERHFRKHLSQLGLVPATASA